MHPNRIFAWQDDNEMLAFIGRVSFATIFVGGGDPGFVVHVPVVAGERRIRFHVARGNRAAQVLDNAPALLSCLGPDAYVSPDWYGTPDQVPTWNYLAVEAEGPLRRMGQTELVELLDDLSALHETRLAPKKPWTRAKMTPGRFEAMAKAIVGYELQVEALRGTRKLGQNKKAYEIEGAAAALRAAGSHEMAELMRISSPAKAGEES